MTQTSRIRVSDLDFLSIKDSLKSYLKTKPEFNTMDFEGSNINVILDILSYNTHYSSLIANFAVNEMFMDTAVKRTSIVSHAKALGYVPYSNKAAEAVVTLRLTATDDSPASLFMPAGTRFIGTNELGDYFFSATQQYEVSKLGTPGNYYYEFANVVLAQGIYTSEKSIYDYVYPYVNLNNTEIDLSTLRVRAIYTDTAGFDLLKPFQVATTFLNLEGDSLVYFIQEGFNGNYQVYFGDGVVGYEPQDGTEVFTDYVVTAGKDGNSCKRFSLAHNFWASNVGSIVNYVTTITISHGGRDKENTESIKYNALNYFGSQDRAVVADDYRALVAANSANIRSVITWGGEDNVPPKYGKLIFCVIPEYGVALTNQEKEDIIALVKPKAVANVQFEFVDPDYIDLSLSVDLSYDRKKMTSTADMLETNVRSSIMSYANTELNAFGGVFRYSKVLKQIDLTEKAVTGSSAQISLIKEMSPELFTNRPYVVSFNNKIGLATASYSVRSTQFNTTSANNMFFADDKMGNLHIMSVTNGVTYVKVYKAGTVDYAAGVVNINPIAISSYVGEYFLIYATPFNNVVESKRNVVLRMQNKYVNINKLPEG